mmetsp:Transcript_67199/g.160993  ORF Transcript_67199/g.160993 Transcript_67199/m.160993 type:complete len:409 (+) Transcript_67199:73-1299(+)
MSLSMNELIPVGILLEILAAAIGTTSKQLIAISAHLHRPALFHLGAGMNILVGPVVDASAYGFAPTVIVAPFACLDVIFNALTAPYTLHWQHEKLTKAHFCGCGLVFCGAVLTAIFADADYEVMDVHALEAQLLRPASVAYLGAELLLMASAIFALKRGLFSPMVRGVALGVIAGVLMGNVFFVKGFIGLVRLSFHDGDAEAWLRPTPYVMIACAAAGALLGHVFMRKGLAEYKGVFMVTIFQGAHIAAACLSGSVVMSEMADVPWWQRCLYWSSFCLIVAGMLIINTAAPEAQLEKGFHLQQDEIEEAKTPIGKSSMGEDDFPSMDVEQAVNDIRSQAPVMEEKSASKRKWERKTDGDEVSSSESTGTPEPEQSPRAVAAGREEARKPSTTAAARSGGAAANVMPVS